MLALGLVRSSRPVKSVREVVLPSAELREEGKREEDEEKRKGDVGRTKPSDRHDEGILATPRCRGVRDKPLVLLSSCSYPSP